MVSDYDFYIIVAISQFVLILVLMEYGLWLNLQKVWRTSHNWVLILVLMEYGLWPLVDSAGWDDPGES